MKKHLVINNLRCDKALLFASKYNDLKEQLSMIGAELNDYIISYNDENEDNVFSILNDYLGIKFNN